jgi:hypothetical protein
MHARDAITGTLARSFEVALEWMKSGVSQLAEYCTADAIAGAVQTVASAVEAASGPAAALAITAASGAAVAGIASYASVRELGDGFSRERRHVLAYVIGCVEEEELCDPWLAHLWRLAVGAGRVQLPAEWTSTAVRIAAGAALASTLGKRAPKKVLRVGATLDIVRVAERARKAHRLVMRARHHARAFADSTRARSDPPE